MADMYRSWPSLVLAGLLALPACTPDEPSPPRENQALWVLVHGVKGGGLDDNEEVHAYDISDPGSPRAVLLVHENQITTFLRTSPTPWGAALLEHRDDAGFHHELVRLDGGGDPQRVSFLDHPSHSLRPTHKFSADGSWMIAEAYDDDFRGELWAIEFDAGVAVDARLLDSYGEGSELVAFGVTPSADAALWTGMDSEFAAPSPLMMAPLGQSPSTPTALTDAPVEGFALFGDKLLIFDYWPDDIEQGTLMLPLDDLGADPVAGPPRNLYASRSGDGQWECRVEEDDSLVVYHFEGLSVSEPMVVETDGLTPTDGCDLSRPGLLIYEADTVLAGVDLEGSTPGSARVLAKRGTYGYLRPYAFSPDREALVHIRDEGGGSQTIEIVDLPAAENPTVLGTLSDMEEPWLITLDSQRMAVRGIPEGGEGRDYWVIEFGDGPGTTTLTPVDTGRPPGTSVDRMLFDSARSEIVYELVDDDLGTETLWRTTLDGMGPQAITTTPGYYVYSMVLLRE